MGLHPSAIVVRLTAATLSSLPGSPLAHYAMVLDLGRVFRWAPNSVLVADGRTVLGSSGGYAGAWIAVREDDAGADLTDDNETLTVGDGGWRTMPSATLTDDRVLTLSTVNAMAGDQISITRLDATGYNMSLVNGGIAGGTVVTMIAETVATVQFNGTNWRLRSSCSLA